MGCWVTRILATQISLQNKNPSFFLLVKLVEIVEISEWRNIKCGDIKTEGYPRVYPATASKNGHIHIAFRHF